MNRFIVSANYMVDGRVQKRTYIVAAASIIEAIRSAKTDDLLQVTSVALDDAKPKSQEFSSSMRSIRFSSRWIMLSPVLSIL